MESFLYLDLDLKYLKTILTKFKKFEAIFDYKLEQLKQEDRIIFTCFTIFILVISITANLTTIIVNLKRKIRPLFRTCLLSLAFSDLISTITSGSTFLSQTLSDFVQIWYLGEILCDFAPFLAYTAIIVNSSTLMGIAFDRYMAVRNLGTGTWEPGLLFCIVYSIAVWGLAAGISSPMLSSYFVYNVKIALTDPNDRKIITDVIEVEMCRSDKQNNSLYYIVVFSIVFVPIMFTFLWFNSVIAKEIWNRRSTTKKQSLKSKLPKNSLKNKIINKFKSEQNSTAKKNLVSLSSLSISSSICKCAEDSDDIIECKCKPIYVKENTKHISTITQSYNSAQAINQQKCNNQEKVMQCHRRLREARQFRMFTVVIMLMLVFLVCRLPSWIYLMIRFNTTCNLSTHWILHYAFGVLSLANCMLNPFIYTFLTETIQFMVKTKRKIKDIALCCGRLCRIV